MENQTPDHLDGIQAPRGAAAHASVPEPKSIATSRRRRRDRADGERCAPFGRGSAGGGNHAGSSKAGAHRPDPRDTGPLVWDAVAEIERPIEENARARSRTLCRDLPRGGTGFSADY